MQKQILLVTISAISPLMQGAAFEDPSTLIATSDRAAYSETPIFGMHTLISKEGKKIEAKLWEELDHLENTLMGGFNSEEKELLITWLKRIENNIQCEKPSK